MDLSTARRGARGGQLKNQQHLELRPGLSRVHGHWPLEVWKSITQVPSELITTGGYLGSAGLSTNGRELRLGVPKLPPLARLRFRCLGQQKNRQPSG